MMPPSALQRARRSCRRPGLHRTRAGRCAAMACSESREIALHQRVARASAACPSALRKIFVDDGQRAIRAADARAASRQYRPRPGSRRARARSPARSAARSVKLPEPYLRMRERESRDRARHADAERASRAICADRLRRCRRGTCRASSRRARSRDSRWRSVSLRPARWITMKPPPPILPARG